jgi:hypothetical protein
LISSHEKRVKTMTYEISWIEGGGCACDKSAAKTKDQAESELQTVEIPIEDVIAVRAAEEAIAARAAAAPGGATPPPEPPSPPLRRDNRKLEVAGDPQKAHFGTSSASPG